MDTELIKELNKRFTDEIIDHVNGRPFGVPVTSAAGFAYLAVDKPVTYNSLLNPLGQKYTIAHSIISCHGSLMSTLSNMITENTYGLSLTSVYGGYYKEGEEFWDFITSKESPWRDLFKDCEWEKIINVDKFIGYVVPTEILNTKALIPLLYSFMIMARQTIEFPECIKAWYHIVHDHNYPPIRAILLSRFFLYNKGNYTSSNLRIDGGHWPLSDVTYSNQFSLDVGAFEKGEYNKTYNSVNAVSNLWLGKYHKEKLDPRISKAQIHVPTRFSQYTVTDIAPVIKDFDERINARIENNA